MKMLTAALAYATRLGWPMLAVSKTKGPLCQHGVHSATTDPADLRGMWEREPEANPAVRCEQFEVLDVDPRNAGADTVNQWGLQYGDFPITWEAATGSGGTHLYFRRSQELEGIPLGKIAPGVDYKGNGRHYVLVPPSVSRSGPYRWIVRPSACELAPAPRWLIDLIVETKRLPPPAPMPDLRHIPTNDRVDRAQRYARALPPAISGSGGHDVTFRAAVLIARGFALNEGEAFAVLSEWNSKCQPEWSERDLRRKVQQAIAHGSMPFGALLERKAS